MEATTLHQLEQFVNDFPYCAPAQLLLAKKYQQSDDPLFMEQACKAAIFFTNPHWLNGLLYPDGVQATEEKPNEKITILADSAIVAETTIPEEETVAVDETTEVIQPAEISASVSLEEETNIISGEALTDDIPLQPEEAGFQPAIPDNPDRNTIADEATVSTDDDIKEDEAISSDSKENTVSGEAPIEEQHPEETGLAAAHEVEQAPLEGDASFKPVIPAAKLRSILDKPATPDPNGETLIPIEPLHTVDYFASQGIKISADIEGQDRLSIKLRSFTDWLKTMKRIHPEKLESVMDQGAQSAIQHIAEHSNEAKEVVTEAMAEVFARQGLHHKALEVYRKLSLLNPGKRVYFAAKISKLNDS